MHPNRVVLANQPPLLRKLLWQAIENVSDIEVAGEANDLAGLMPLIERSDPQWVIVTLEPDGRLPDIVDMLLARQPALHVLALSHDGSQTKIRWIATCEEALENPSLHELIELLHEETPGGLKLSEVFC